MSCHDESKRKAGCGTAESPILGRGDALMFTSADTDLAGSPRLRDGRLDPGCYECWLNSTGTLILFR